MAHLIKMLLKNATVPTKFGKRCASRLLTLTLYYVNQRKFHACRDLYKDKSHCFIDSEINLDGKQQSENQEKPDGKLRKIDSKAVRIKHSTLRKVRSVVGVSVTPFAVGWAKIDVREMRLKECLSEYLNTEGTDITESLACRKMKDIVTRIPNSDVYILESCKNFSKQFKEIRANEIQTMLSSMLAVQLYDPGGPLGEDNVFFQTKSVIDNLYKLTVKWERVSAGQVLQRLLGSTVAEHVSERNDNITITVEGIKLSTTSNVMHSIFYSLPSTRDASAVAFFVALSFVQANLKFLPKFEALSTSDTTLN